MKSNQVVMEQELKEKEKIIQYLKTQFQAETGKEITIPVSLTSVLGIKSPSDMEERALDIYSNQREEMRETFLEAVHKLNLPSPLLLAGGKKGQEIRDPKKIPKSVIKKYEFLEVINLSDFKHRGLSRAALRQLVTGVQLLPCIRTIVLRNNGISDDYLPELSDLLSVARIKSLDLSQNELERAGGRQISRKLKDQVTNLQWIDLSGNFFDKQTTINQILLQGLRNQRNLQHAGFSVRSPVVEQAVRLFQQKNTLRSLSLKGSEISWNATLTLYHSLSTPTLHITAISLRYCILQQAIVERLALALPRNRTLVKLDLSRCAMKDEAGIALMVELRKNITLSELNLSGNLLGDAFIQAMAQTLSVNEVLYECDISHNNNITPRGGQALLQVLVQSNESLGSLGELQYCFEMGIRIKEKIRQCLQLNKASPQVRRALAGAKAAEKISEMKLDERSLQVLRDIEFPLSKPIAFTNKLQYDPSMTRLWNI